MFRLSARKRTQLLFRATIPNSTKNPSIHDHATQKSQIVGAATTPWPREKGLTKMCARERERERERGGELRNGRVAHDSSESLASPVVRVAGGRVCA